jgi:sigma-B regulation protein RsbU (phosphoserine phosphatase)
MINKQYKFYTDFDSLLIRSNHVPQDHELDTIFAAFNKLSEGMVITDKDGKSIFCNPAAKKFFGTELKNIPLEKWTSIIGFYYPDQHTPYPLEKLQLALTGSDDRIMNERLFIQNSNWPDGAHISLDAGPVKNTQGSIIGGSICIRDISSKIKSEIYLKESREKLKTQFKEYPQPTYVWQYTGDDFILTDYNHAAQNFNQGSIRKHIGIKLSQMYGDSPEILTDFWTCFNNKSTLQREMVYAFKKDTKNRDWIVNYTYLPPDSILVHTEDITERKYNERQLLKLSSAVEQTADSVLLTDKHGIIEYINPAFEKTTGYTSAEVIGKTPAILKSGTHDEAFYKTLWDVILAGDSYTGTILNKKKNGELYWCEQSITPMKNSEGKITNFVSVIKDISELKKKQEQDFYLHIAKEVQERFSKSKLSIPGFDVDGTTFSALETGGDYFDFLYTPDGHILLAVGDVSGHGVGAALIMAETRAFLRAFSKKESDPAILLEELNVELISDLDDNHYVTLILVRIDPRQNTLDYASAGHIPAYIVDNSGKVTETLKSTGIPLGFLAGEKYLLSNPITVSSGNILALLTDGITEAISKDGTEFGIDRMIELIKNHQSDSAKQISSHLAQAVCSFTELQHQEDDITSVICKVN